VSLREGSELSVEKKMYETLRAIANDKSDPEQNRYLRQIGQRIKEALGYGKVNANSNDQIRRRIARERGLRFEVESTNNSTTEDIVWNAIPYFRDINPLITSKTKKFFDDWIADIERREEARNPVAEEEDKEEGNKKAPCGRYGCAVVGGRRRRSTRKTKRSKRSKRTRGSRRG
jgi:hypothetical protein